MTEVGRMCADEKRFYERRKLIYMAAGFALTIAGYTLIKELKDAFFVGIVGADQLWLAKQLTLFMLIPLVFIYSKLVDRLRRHQLLYVYTILYGVLGLVIAWFLGHPDIGIANTDTSAYRYFGWFLYFLFEGYSPFVVSLFWAFNNSVSDPEEAKRSYPIVTIASKAGGAFTAGAAWLLLGFGGNYLSDVLSHQILLIFASLLLLAVPVVIYFMMKNVPGRFLHGYEAVYKVEKEKSRQEKKMAVSASFGDKTVGFFKGMVNGITMFFKYPYVVGIFGMIFFYELLNVVLNYHRIMFVRSVTKSLTSLSASLFLTIFYMHIVGIFIAYFGTRTLIKKLGERRCLILIPALAGVLLLCFMLNYLFNYPIMSGPAFLSIVYIVIRSINYGFSYPLRESLYIPTVKEVKFKSKSWIDSTGSKLAKATGAFFYGYTSFAVPGTMAFFNVYSAFFGGIVGLWLLVAHFLGRRYEWAIEHNEVIGAPDAASKKGK